ncbi:MAG: chemotaxis protein CheB [Bauldia sp.]
MQPASSNRDVIAIGASAGGVEALRKLTSELPGNLPASVLVTLHLSPQFASSLDEILTRAGPLPATFAEPKGRMERSRIYIAPPDHHLLAVEGRLELGIGPRENYTRPAIDPMFRSVAVCCGPRSIGVVLTGTMGDGASGLWAIKAAGGATVVQDPRDAAYPGMPMRALDEADPDHVTTLAALPGLLVSLSNGPAGESRQLPQRVIQEVEIARTGRSEMDTMDRIGRRSVFTCPDCNGIMWEIDEGQLVRYRCHVGHAYTAELMALALDESLRRSLASALRGLEERAAVARKLHHEAVGHGRDNLAPRWARQAADLEREADTIRDTIRRIDMLAAGTVDTDAA